MMSSSTCPSSGHGHNTHLLRTEDSALSCPARRAPNLWMMRQVLYLYTFIYSNVFDPTSGKFTIALMPQITSESHTYRPPREDRKPPNARACMATVFPIKPRSCNAWGANPGQYSGVYNFRHIFFETFQKFLMALWWLLLRCCKSKFVGRK